MNKTQDIKDIFSMFHDGYIDSFKIENNRIDLKIGIQYLAELIDERYKYLHLSLYEVESIKYDVWTDESFIMTDWSQIFELGIDILNVEMDDLEQVTIHSNCDNAPNDEFRGGKLIIKCLDYNMRDEGDNSLTIEKLKELSTYYWNVKCGQ
ncbi:MAG: hypothetical protein ACI81Y_002835 [Glaciecola sp.]|jgi:hypothetical protein